jgi:hypothetical protein
VWLWLRDASSVERTKHGCVARVRSIDAARGLADVSLYERQPWCQSALLMSSLAAVAPETMSVQCYRCHRLYLSSGGTRLFRSDDRIFDHRWLYVPLDHTRVEHDILKRSRAVASTLPQHTSRELVQRAIDRTRSSLEMAQCQQSQYSGEHLVRGRSVSACACARAIA